MAKTMSGQKAVTPSADGILASIEATKSRDLPPVHLWNPPFCGDIDMRIARDGTWFYQGSPIRRERMVRLFSSILKREGEEFFLVTPVEKVGIKVDLAPFIALDFEIVGDGAARKLIFETHVGDHFAAGPANALRVETDPETQTPLPLVHVRGGLDALIDRKSFYRIFDLCVEHAGKFGVWSDGVFFELMSAEELGDLAD